MDILRDPLWQTVGVITGLVLALTTFVGFILRDPSPKREKAKRIILVSIVSILIGAIISALIYFPQLQKSISANIPPPYSPTQVFTTYCSAINNKDYQTAWDQESGKLQSRVTPATLSQIAHCTLKSVNDKSGFGTLTLIMVDSQGFGGIGGNGDYLYSMIRANGEWKIDSVCEFIQSGVCFGS